MSAILLRLSARSLIVAAIASGYWGGRLVAADADAPPPEAMGILRGIEGTRSAVKPFRMRGVLKRVGADAELNVDFVVEYEDGKYRVTSGNANRSVAIFDGDKLFCYDGRDSSIITTPDQRATACFAFDPKTFGISTSLHSDHTLKESIAYHDGKEIAFTRQDGNAAQRATATIELTDRFGQRIRFDVQPRSPYRVHRYSKTIPRKEGDRNFIRYVTETEYWPDNAKNWLPRRLVMYDQPDGDNSKRSAETVVEFEKPEFVAKFDPEIWTATGLSMPNGQPLVDLRIKQRIGYWDGSKLVESVP